MKIEKSGKGLKLGIGIILGAIVGYLTSNMQLWFVLGIAIGSALEYDAKKNHKNKNHSLHIPLFFKHWLLMLVTSETKIKKSKSEQS